MKESCTSKAAFASPRLSGQLPHSHQVPLFSPPLKTLSGPGKTLSHQNFGKCTAKKCIFSGVAP